MFSVTPVVGEDLAEIVSLDLDVASYSHNAIVLSDSIQAWRTWMESGLVYKAVHDNGNIIGVIIAFMVKKHGWCIHKVLVANDYLQDNVALRLFENMLAKVDHREEKVYTLVHPQDLYAINLYTMLGFEKKSLKKDYLGLGEDRCLMSRKIQWSDVAASKKKSRLKATSSWGLARMADEMRKIA